LLLWGEPGDALVELSHLKQPQEEVGPLTLIHDHDTGSTTVQDHPDLLEALRRSRGLTAEQAALVLTRGKEPSDAQIEKARRQLRKLEKSGLATEKTGSKGGAGGSVPSQWFARDINHEVNHAARLPEAATSPNGQPRGDASQIQGDNHDSDHANHEPINHVRPSLLREGATWKAADENANWEVKV
jgi:hypothetical protein